MTNNTATSTDSTPTLLIESSAPARVNLIGEHTDYTGGYVLPMAIPFYTTISITDSVDKNYHFASGQFPSVTTLTHPNDAKKDGTWSDYPIGVLLELQAKGIKLPPFSLHADGNVPLGSGLSSSASIEVATAIALLAYAGQALSAAEIALLCQRAENHFVESPCGIMDQFVVTAAEAQNALLLNTRSLAFELLPLDRGALKNTCVIIANSTIKHSIASGDYVARRREVEDGQSVLRSNFPSLRDLGDATIEDLNMVKSHLTEESYRRCKHILTENMRVLRAKDAMLAGDAELLGRLMVESHLSQRDDFACSTPEVDFLVECATNLPGCYGARLTGGGFGGCTVNLVDNGRAEFFTTELQKAYFDRYNLHAPVFHCYSVDGAVRLRAEQKGRP